MNVIYFFIILCIVNIAMFLLITQCLKYYKNKSSEFQSVIMVAAVILFTLISALIYTGMVGWNTTENFYPYWNLNNGFKVSPERKQCMAETSLYGIKKRQLCSLSTTRVKYYEFPP